MELARYFPRLSMRFGTWTLLWLVLLAGAALGGWRWGVSRDIAQLEQQWLRQNNSSPRQRDRISQLFASPGFEQSGLYRMLRQDRQQWDRRWQLVQQAEVTSGEELTVAMLLEKDAAAPGHRSYLVIAFSPYTGKVAWREFAPPVTRAGKQRWRDPPRLIRLPGDTERRLVLERVSWEMTPEIRKHVEHYALNSREITAIPSPTRDDRNGSDQREFLERINGPQPGLDALTAPAVPGPESDLQ